MSAPFKAQLVALGDPTSIEMSEFNYENTVALVFLAEVEEVRKAAPLFRQQVTLHPGDVLAAPAEALRLAGCAMVGEPTPEALASGIGELALRLSSAARGDMTLLKEAFDALLGVASSPGYVDLAQIDRDRVRAVLAKAGRR
jgi:hypothetical protein